MDPLDAQMGYVIEERPKVIRRFTSVELVQVYMFDHARLRDGGGWVQLPKNGKEVLRALWSEAGKVVTVGSLIGAIGRRHAPDQEALHGSDASLVRVVVFKLRQALRTMGSLDRITTVRGEGYRWVRFEGEGS